MTQQTIGGVRAGWTAMWPRMLVCFGLVGFMTACSGGGGGGGSLSAPPDLPAAKADISLLFMGNSHTDFHDVPGMVADFVRAARPGKTVSSEQVPGYLFLDERLTDTVTLSRLNGQRWSGVILQAQKYSSSGQLTYSTSEAEELVRISRRQGAVPVMFPEWPRKGIAETQRIFDIHVSIARNAPACVAPIGQAWDLAAVRDPGLALHDPDGNHARPAGAMLAAMMIAATLTGQSPLTFPTLSQRPVDAATQAQLRAFAAETIQVVSPRTWCPSDPFLP